MYVVLHNCKGLKSNSSMFERETFCVLTMGTDRRQTTSVHCSRRCSCSQISWQEAFVFKPHPLMSQIVAGLFFPDDGQQIAAKLQAVFFSHHTTGTEKVGSSEFDLAVAMERPGEWHRVRAILKYSGEVVEQSPASVKISIMWKPYPFIDSRHMNFLSLCCFGLAFCALGIGQGDYRWQVVGRDAVSGFKPGVAASLTLACTFVFLGAVAHFVAVTPRDLGEIDFGRESRWLADLSPKKMDTTGFIVRTKAFGLGDIEANVATNADVCQYSTWLWLKTWCLALGCPMLGFLLLLVALLLHILPEMRNLQEVFAVAAVVFILVGMRLIVISTKLLVDWSEPALVEPLVRLNAKLHQHSLEKEKAESPLGRSVGRPRLWCFAWCRE